MNQQEISFGLSSFLFLIPFFYCIKTNNKNIYWIIALFCLVISSFLCNYFINCYNCYFVLCDKTIIIILSIIYFLCFSRLNIALLICILFFIEMSIYTNINVTLMISFLTLNLFAFTNFTKNELIIGIICFCIGTFCKIYRNTTCEITYPIYTTIWHICCVTLLILASRSLNR
jgi:hypothetical protein